MGRVIMLRDQLRQAHRFLDDTVADLTTGQAHWLPVGHANPLGASYAHILLGEDAFIAQLSGRAPLFATIWANRTGVSELPPLAVPGETLPLGRDWHEWGRRVRVDLPTMRTYAEAVQQASDEFLASLHDNDLDQMLDLSAAGLGQQPLQWVLSEGLVGHVRAHWGEIVCLKGLQGGQGFPV